MERGEEREGGETEEREKEGEWGLMGTVVHLKEDKASLRPNSDPGLSQEERPRLPIAAPTPPSLSGRTQTVESLTGSGLWGVLHHRGG